jgi:hypothetical protein
LSRSKFTVLSQSLKSISLASQCLFVVWVYGQQLVTNAQGQKYIQAEKKNIQQETKAQSASQKASKETGV